MRAWAAIPLVLAAAVPVRAECYRFRVAISVTPAAEGDAFRLDAGT